MWRMANPSDDDVSVLFNEPKLLKFEPLESWITRKLSFSALQRAEIAEICDACLRASVEYPFVSVLFNEPKLLKFRPPLPAPPVSQIPIPARRRS